MDISLCATPSDTPAPDSKDEDPRHLRRLRDWLAAAGVAAPVRLVAACDGIDVSLVAAMALQPGDTAVRVPLRLAVTADVAAASPVGVAAASVAAATHGGLPALDAHARLYLYLIACRVAAVRERERGDGGGGGNSNSDGDGDITKGYPHAPYVATLPAAFDDPSHWTAEQVGWLAGTNLAAALPARLAALRATYDAVVPLLSAARPDVFPPDVYTWDAWTWAVSAYTSRAFPARLGQLGDRAVEPLIAPSQCVGNDVGGDGGGVGGRGGIGVCSGGSAGTRATTDPPGLLIPVLDSCNHRLGAPVTWRAVACVGDSGGGNSGGGTGSASTGVAHAPTAAAAGAVELVVDYPVAAGEPIVNNYGPKANESLLMGYGFCLDGRAGGRGGAPGGHYEWDVYPLKLSTSGEGVDPDDWARLLVALRREGLDGVHYLRHPRWRRRPRGGRGGKGVGPDASTAGVPIGTDGDGNGNGNDDSDDSDGDMDDSGDGDGDMDDNGDSGSHMDDNGDSGSHMDDNGDGGIDMDDNSDGDGDGDVDDSEVIPPSVLQALALTMLAAGGVLWEVTSDAAQTAVIPEYIEDDPDFWADVGAELATVLNDRLKRLGGPAVAEAEEAELAALDRGDVPPPPRPSAGPPDDNDRAAKGGGDAGAPPSWAEALERIRPDAAAAAARRRRAALLYRSSQRAILAAAIQLLWRQAAEAAAEDAKVAEDWQTITHTSNRS